MTGRLPATSAALRAGDICYLQAKILADAARDVPGSTLVVAMAGNGTDFSIQVSGTGDR